LKLPSIKTMTKKPNSTRENWEKCRNAAYSDKRAAKISVCSNAWGVRRV